MRISIINLENGKTLKIELPNDLKKYKEDFRNMGFTDDYIKYNKVPIEDIYSGIQYVDKVIQELKEVNISELNDLSLCIYQYWKEKREKYNAILKYEYIKGNIKNVSDLIQITFEEDNYLYEKNVNNITDLTNKIKERSEDTEKISHDETKNIVESFKKNEKGCFSEYNKKMGYVMCFNPMKIHKRKEISEYLVVDWCGERYKFKSDIITALGVVTVTDGKLYKDKEILYSVDSDYNNRVEELEKLTGRKPKEIFKEEIEKRYGIIPIYLGDERLIDFEILRDIQENQEEFEF